MTKTIVITGGTSGIGMHTAIGLARQGARVVVTGRDAARGAAGVEQIKRESGSPNVALALGDLSSVAQIKRLAAHLRERYPVIHVLINNAGMLARSRELTSDGAELDFAVNVIAPYTLTMELLPALEAARPSRVVNVTGGLPVGDLDLDNLQAEKGFRGLVTYSHAKRALEAMSLALAEELAPRGVFVNVVFPGPASTNMTQVVKRADLPWWMQMAWPIVRRMLTNDGGKGAAKASRSSVWAATSTALEGVSGRYFDADSKPARFKRKVTVPANQRQIIQTIGRFSGARTAAGDIALLSARSRPATSAS